MSKPQDDLASLYAYNAWANERILAALRDLPAEAYARELGGGWPSLRATLVHLAGATDAWAERFEGRDATRLPTEEELPALADAEALLRRAQSRLEALLPSFTPERLAGGLTWKNLKREERTAPLWAVARHVVNHASYHRGQIASMVKRAGGKAASTDMVLWGIELSAKAR